MLEGKIGNKMVYFYWLTVADVNLLLDWQRALVLK